METKYLNVNTPPNKGQFLEGTVSLRHAICIEFNVKSVISNHMQKRLFLAILNWLFSPRYTKS